MRKILYTIILYTISIYCGKVNAQSNPCVGTAGQITWEIYRGLYEGSIPHLQSWHDYPYHPSDKKTLYSTKAPANYENLFGARIRGFINVPIVDSVTFNLTGNEAAQFYLSMDSLASNKTLLASVPSNTLAEEFTKFPSQTSVKVFLQPGKNYYFEVIYADPSGNDHVNLWWKTSFVDINNWKPITFDFLKDIACLQTECPMAGTLCNDNNPSTYDDREDGLCHCIGALTTVNNCIGPRNHIENFRYDNITGSSLNDLYNNSAFPAMPSYSEVLPILAKPSSTRLTNFGRSTQGYLKVPVSGNYKFNITGDDNTVFYLSTNESPSNKTATTLTISNFTGTAEYSKSGNNQTSNNVFLDANLYYYIEVNNKQSAGNGHFSVYWQTPFTEANQWKRLPSTFLYKYECSLACIPQGTLCDDGNIFTTNDMYNASCVCTGTTCASPNCLDPQANYIPHEKCNVTNNLDDRNDLSWQSCQKTANPNNLRGTSHWIKYDLGDKHRLLTSQVWNYNIPGSIQEGFQNVAIDVSLDGTNWTEYGFYNWALASGSNGYGGFTGPDFQGEEARYILITSLDGGSGCRGIGKVAFKTVYCPSQGVACNDNDLTTTNDRFDANCLCKGISLYDNLCTDEFKILGDSLLQSTNYSAIEYVSSISEVDANKRTSFIAGNYVELNPGFSTTNTAVFIAAIDSCNSALNSGLWRLASKINNVKSKKQKEVPTEMLQITSNDKRDEYTIQYYVANPSDVRLELKDSQLKTIYTFQASAVDNRGYYTKVFKTKKLEQGLYNIIFNSNGVNHTKSFVVD